MAHFFDVYGPFAIGRDQGQIVRGQGALWEDVETADEGLSSAIGCYMFCLQHGDNLMPWHVGKLPRPKALGARRSRTTSSKLITEAWTVVARSSFYFCSQ